MQRSPMVLALMIVSGLALTGCPEKKAEKEEVASPDTPAAADQAGADEDKAEEKAEEAADPTEGAEKNEEKADEGGW